MFLNIAIEKHNSEDGTKFDIRVLLIDGKFRINDVGVKRKGKRKYIYMSSQISDRYEYRKLDGDERIQYMLNEFIKICGVDLLSEAMEEAWLSLKPESIKV